MFAAIAPLLAQIPLSAERIHNAPTWLNWSSNSVLVGIVVVVLILVWTRRATKEICLVPAKPGGQNLAEGVIEMLYSTLVGIVGGRMIARVFPLLATFFLFILTANWFSLLPGVGTIGFGEHRGSFLSLPHLEAPLLRATNADLNMTLAMALVFMVAWLYWTISELGVWGFIKHTFGVKGGLKGILKFLLAPLFFFVGVIEIISIIFRPVSLSLRLFGNVYAGENLLHTMSDLGHMMHAPDWLAFVMSFVIPIPFYFLEILVGILQALVFTLLCAVYIQLSTTHEEGHGEAGPETAAH
jgi:F-type H+-transporting ATPase subunit a